MHGSNIHSIMSIVQTPPEINQTNSDSLKADIHEATRRPTQDSPNLTARWVSDLEELESLVELWNDLADATIHRNAAFESNYLLPAIRHLANDRVRVIVVEYDSPAGPQLAGLAPFVRTRVLGLPFSAVQIWKQEQIFDATPLLRQGMAESAWQAIIQFLKSEKFRFLELDTVSAESQFGELVELTASQLAGMFRKKTFERAAIVPMESADAYRKQSMSSSLRKKLRRLFRRLEDKGTITFESSSSSSNYKQLAEQFLSLEQSGWKGKNGTALASNKSTADFFEEFVALSDARRKLRFLTMRLDDQPIAMLVDIQSGRQVFAYKTTFDETYKPFSPGMQIEIENIETLHRDQIELADSCTSSDESIMTRVWSERAHFQHVVLPLNSGIPKWITRILPVAQKLSRWARRK